MLQSIHKSYKVEINPTNKQKEILIKNFGCVRFVYNWCVEKFQKESNKSKEDRIPFSKFGYIREFTYIKNNKEYDFLKDNDISSVAVQQSVLNFASSVNKFFKEGSGFPQFKKKYVSRDSYREFNNNIQRNDDGKGTIRTFERKIFIPILKWTKIKGKPEKYLPKDKIISSITLFKDVDKYFISIYYKDDISIVDDNIEERNPNFEVIGIDLGIKNLMTICNNNESIEIIENIDFTKKYKDKLEKAQQKLSKKQKGSNNRRKQAIKVAKIHRKIRYSRNDYIHKTTNYITSRTKNSIIIMEDMNNKSMIMNSNRILSRSLSNVSFYEIQRQIEYKSLLNGNRLDKTSKYYPSTQLCSGCGNIQDMELSNRLYQCNNIHCIYNINPIDRDYNSSINIRDYYFKYIRQAMA